MGYEKAVRYFLYFYNLSMHFKFCKGQSTPPPIIKHWLDQFVNHASYLIL